MRQASQFSRPIEFNYEELENRVALAADAVSVMATDVQPPNVSPAPSQVITDNALFLSYQQFVREMQDQPNAPTSGNVIIVNPTSFFQFDAQGNLVATGPSSSLTSGSSAILNSTESFAIFADTSSSGFALPSGSFAIANLGLGQNQLSSDGFLMIYNGSTLNDGLTLFGTFTQAVDQVTSNSNIQATSLSIPAGADTSLVQSPQLISGIPSNQQINPIAQLPGQPVLPLANIRPQAAASTKDRVVGTGSTQPSFAPLTLQRATVSLSDSVDSALRMADRVITGKPSFPARVDYLRDSLPLPINAGISVLRAVSNSIEVEKAPPSSEYRPNLELPPSFDPDVIDQQFSEFDEAENEFADIAAVMCVMSATPFIIAPSRRHRDHAAENISSN